MIATCDGSGKIPYRGHEEDVCAVSPTVLPPFEVARLQHPAYVAGVGYGLALTMKEVFRTQLLSFASSESHQFLHLVGGLVQSL